MNPIITTTKRSKRTPKPVAQVTETTITNLDGVTGMLDTPLPTPAPVDPQPDAQPGPAPVKPAPEETAVSADPMAAIRLRAREMAARPTRKTPKACACGCGGFTKGGDWISGHNGIALKRELEAIRKAEAQPLTMTA